MFRKKKPKKIEQEIKVFFEKMDFDVQIDISFDNEVLNVNLKTEEPRVLIGQKGKTLSDIQHLLRAILYKKTKEHFYLNIDINEYRKNKSRYLREMAIETANDVALSGEEQALEPMNSFERRVIHMELAEREDVSTESVGREPQRCVVVRPATPTL